MYVVKAHGKNWLWMNPKKCEFADRLPEYFGLDESEIEVKEVVDGAKHVRRAALLLTPEEQAAGVHIAVDVSGEVPKLCKRNSEGVLSPIQDLELKD